MEPEPVVSTPAPKTVKAASPAPAPKAAASKKAPAAKAAKVDPPAAKATSRKAPAASKKAKVEAPATPEPEPFFAATKSAAPAPASSGEDWSALSAAALGRKTVGELTKYLAAKVREGLVALDLIWFHPAATLNVHPSFGFLSRGYLFLTPQGKL